MKNLTLKSSRTGKKKNKTLALSRHDNNNNNNNNNKKAFVKATCAPTAEKKDYTCFSDTALTKMKNLWNARHPDTKIVSDESRDIWKHLKNNLQEVCNSENCWLKQEFITNNLDSEMTSYTVAPTSPKSWTKNKNEWLSSVDIEKVMKQFEKKYKCFDFIGPSPIDFDAHMLYNECVWKELCHFDLKTLLSKGKNKIGIIFNTDPHYKDGSHWISMFIHVKKGYIFYFDSNGNPVPKEIKVLVDRIIDQANKLNIKLTFDQNYPMEHQYSNTECGMYSLYFIIQLLRETHNIDFFKNHRIKDKDMENLRGEYFTPFQNNF